MSAYLRIWEATRHERAAEDRRIAVLVDVDESEVASVHARLVDRDMAYSPHVVEQALEMWLAEECEQLAKDCAGRSAFLEWLDHFAVREFKDCCCIHYAGDKPNCPKHGEAVTA